MSTSVDHVQLTAKDGHAFDTYVAKPTGKPRGAIVVVQEIFGVNSHIRSVADNYAADGYLAIAPALFDRAERGVELGYDADDRTRGMALKSKVDNEQALMDIAACIEHVGSAGKVGIVGYCWGGTLAWLSAVKLDGLSAAVTYYGGGMQNMADLKARVPVMSHFGEQDTHIPVDAVRGFFKAQPDVDGYFYDADHGFNCDQRPSYDAPSATVAKERSLEWFRKYVG
ncbi:MAG: carboxymethylenebutenolidase [Rhizobacter sp.]|nr:carboxymethylenebutenolidase [Rhizobacter sp.]